MIYNYKLDFFNKLAFLNDLGSKGIPSFPNEVSLFVRRELEMRSVVLLSKTKYKNYTVIGKTASADRIFQIGETFSVKNSKTISEAQKFNDSFISKCELDIPSFDKNVQSIAFGYNTKSIGILLLSHKILPAEDDQKRFFSIAEVIGKLLTIWKNAGGVTKTRSNLQFSELVSKSSKGFRKSAQTINGMLALLNEEKLSEVASNYVNDIKENNQFLCNGLTDMIELTKFEQEDFVLNTSNSDTQKIIDDSVNIFKNNNCTDIKFNIDNQITANVDLDKNLFAKVIQSLIVTSCLVSEDKKINISSKLSSSNKIYFSVSTYTPQINSSDIQNFKDPFVVTDLFKRTFAPTSGLSLTIVKNIIDQINGTFKITIDDEDNIKFLIAFKVGTKISHVPKEEISIPKNKILVIESDMASSTLLQKYLSKWNYKTEFVSSGTKALSLLKNEKYVSIILNIDQENDNSLELLQKIKNNSATKNTPIIVFSIEPEKEQVFLMGSVDYLVKPINYNNLVEILTSYKLRRNSNVLCVDDDKPTLKLVEQAIKTAGFNVVSEHRSEQVMDLIDNVDLDLAIIDLDMPKLNGFDLIKQIKAEKGFTNLPIIIYTGKEDYQEDLEKIDGLFVELLDKKSTSFNELENAISEMINSYEETKPIDEQTSERDNPKILMAEDYKHSQIIVTRLLKKNGFENITVVENGKEALEICEQEKIDIILMDMQMPVMNGFEATGKIRELNGYDETPIIALTAFAMKGDREKCLEAGATDYIAKPIDSKEFIDKVKYYSQQKVVA